MRAAASPPAAGLAAVAWVLCAVTPAPAGEGGAAPRAPLLEQLETGEPPAPRVPDTPAAAMPQRLVVCRGPQRCWTTTTEAGCTGGRRGPGAVWATVSRDDGDRAARELKRCWEALGAALRAPVRGEEPARESGHPGGGPPLPRPVE